MIAHAAGTDYHFHLKTSEANGQVMTENYPIIIAHAQNQQSAPIRASTGAKKKGSGSKAQAYKKSTCKTAV